MTRPTVRTDRTQTCLGCGAAVHLPKGPEILLCFRCRASAGGIGREAPAAVPFQKAASPLGRSPFNLQTTGLLFALFVVVAAVVFLLERRSAGPAESHEDPASRQGGVDVTLVGPRPAGPTKPAPRSSR